MNEVTQAKEVLQPYMDKMETMRAAYSYGVPLNTISSKKSGGSFDEKVLLESIKQENKRDLQKEKQIYTSILKNNEFMQKSLIKVFK